MNVGYNCYDNVNIQKTNLINEIKLCIFVNEAKIRLNHLFWFPSSAYKEVKESLGCGWKLWSDAQICELGQVPSSEQGLSWVAGCGEDEISVSCCEIFPSSNQQEQMVSDCIKLLSFHLILSGWAAKCSFFMCCSPLTLRVQGSLVCSAALISSSYRGSASLTWVGKQKKVVKTNSPQI